MASILLLLREIVKDLKLDKLGELGYGFIIGDDDALKTVEKAFILPLLLCMFPCGAGGGGGLVTKASIVEYTGDGDSNRVLRFKWMPFMLYIYENVEDPNRMGASAGVWIFSDNLVNFVRDTSLSYADIKPTANYFVQQVGYIEFKLGQFDADYSSYGLNRSGVRYVLIALFDRATEVTEETILM